MKKTLCPQFSQNNKRIPKEELYGVILQARAGDKGATARIFEHYSKWIASATNSPRIYGLLPEDLYDCAIDAVYKAIKVFDPKLSGNFLRQIITQFHGKRYARGYHTRKIASSYDEYDDLLDTRKAEESTCDLTEHLCSMVDKLKPAQKELMRKLYGFDGMEFTRSQIAQEEGVSPQAIDSKVNTTLAKLRKSPLAKELRCYL